VEYLDSSEVFYTLYLRNPSRIVVCSVVFFLFDFWFLAAEPPSLVRVRSIRVLTVFYRPTLTLLSLEKRRRGRGRRTTLAWVSSDGPW
jgi:hypothetical protein